MDWVFGASIGVLVYMAFAFDVFGFLARDELWLRLLMLAASGFYIVYYFFVADAPLWDAIITNAVLAGVNLAMILIVVTERTTFSMSPEMAALFRQFPLLTPGQFRRLRRAAEFRQAGAGEVLVTQGRDPDSLYFVVDGDIEIEKDGQAFPARPGIFIGEIAFLTGDPASATVRVGTGARYLRWDRGRIDRLTARSPNLRAALLGHLNMDLARKVARSRPMATA